MKMAWCASGVPSISSLGEGVHARRSCRRSLARGQLIAWTSCVTGACSWPDLAETPGMCVACACKHLKIFLFVPVRMQLCAWSWKETLCLSTMISGDLRAWTRWYRTRAGRTPGVQIDAVSAGMAACVVYIRRDRGLQAVVSTDLAQICTIKLESRGFIGS
jgi:hypothetical protein